MAKSKTTPQSEENGLSLAHEPIMSVSYQINETLIKETIADYEKLFPAGWKVTTKESLDTAKKALKALKKEIKDSDESRLALQREMLAAMRKVESDFDPVISRMETAISDFEKAEALRIEQERLAKEKMVRDREASLYALKAIWNGSQYQLGTVFCSKLDLESDDATWVATMEKFKAERVALDIEANKAKIEARVKDRKMQLLEMGATAGFELDGEPCDAATPGAQYGLRLGDAWAVKSDLERNDDDWRDGTLADFQFEKTKRDNEAAADRQRKRDEAARLDEIERQRNAAEANEAAPVVTPPPVVIVTPSNKHVEVSQELISPVAAPVAVNESQTVTEWAAANALREFTPIVANDIAPSDVQTYLSGAFNFKRVLAIKIKQVHGVDAAPLLDEMFALMAKKYGYTL